MNNFINIHTQVVLTQEQVLQEYGSQLPDYIKPVTFLNKPSLILEDERVERHLYKNQDDSYTLEYKIFKISTKEKLFQVNSKIDVLLRNTGWSQLEDESIETRSLWKSYRNKLRALKEQPNYPWDITWPADPSLAPYYNKRTQRLKEIKDINGDYNVWLVEEKSQAEIVTETINYFVENTQNRLDTFAQSRGYDNVNSAAKYKDITDAEIAALSAAERPLVTKFRAECRHLAIATASTWAKLYLILGEVEAGTRPAPASFADIEPLLPVLAWPAETNPPAPAA